MSGFFDLFAWLLGWKSSGPAEPPFDVSAAGVWHPGAEAGRSLISGTRAGGLWQAGAAAGKVTG